MLHQASDCQKGWNSINLDSSSIVSSKIQYRELKVDIYYIYMVQRWPAPLPPRGGGGWEHGTRDHIYIYVYIKSVYIYTHIYINIIHYIYYIYIYIYRLYIYILYLDTLYIYIYCIYYIYTYKYFIGAPYPNLSGFCSPWLNP